MTCAPPFYREESHFQTENVRKDEKISQRGKSLLSSRADENRDVGCSNAGATGRLI